jgi:hypothetical protein
MGASRLFIAAWMGFFKVPPARRASRNRFQGQALA